MPSTMVDPVIARTLAAAVSIVLFLAAGTKLRDRETFAAVVENYRVLPRALVAPFATVLPWIEIAAAITLLWSPVREFGAVAASALLVAFAAAIAVNVARGRTSIECGCGGGAEPRLSWALVARNLVLGAAALATLAEGPDRPFVAIDALTVAGGTAALVALYHFTNLLLANAPRLGGLRGHP